MHAGRSGVRFNDGPALKLFITDRSKAVLLMWRVNITYCGVRVSVMFHLMFVHYTFNSVWVAE